MGLGLACLCAVLLGSVGSPLRASQGLLELGDRDRAGLPARLDGEWALYWGKLLRPGSDEGGGLPAPDTYLRLPGSWARLKFSGGRLPNRGSATLRLVVRHPWEGQEVAVKLKQVNSAYELYADTTLLSKSGRLEDDPAGYAGRLGPRSFNFVPGSGETVLTLLVSHAEPASLGGVMDSVEFGPRGAVEADSNLSVIFDSFNLGGRLILALLFLAALAYTRHPAVLFYVLNLLAGALRVSCIGEMLILRVFPGQSVTAYCASIYASTALFGLTLFLTFPFLFRDAWAGRRGGRGMAAWMARLLEGARHDRGVALAGLSCLLIPGLFVVLPPTLYGPWSRGFDLVLNLAALGLSAFLIGSAVRAGRASRSLSRIFTFIVVLAFAEALSESRLLRIDSLRPFFFLGHGAGLGASPLASFHFPLQLLSYLSVLALASYLLVSILKSHLESHDRALRSEAMTDSFEASARSFGLSEREREVAALAAQGLSYDEIAERCFISRNTVKAHLVSVYRKLGVGSKTEMVHLLRTRHLHD